MSSLPTPLIERCICSGATFSDARMAGLDMRQCGCGVIHQRVEMDPDSLTAWYRESYHEEVYLHSYEHDYGVAKQRIAKYGGKLEAPVLDIGCGNGAFVDACRHAGIWAEGYDIANHDGPLELLSGPYATVTMHDVIEHAVDPVAMLHQVRRLSSGWLIVDFPAFFEPEGAHHWKPIEHLWMLSGDQLGLILGMAGFRVLTQERPVPGKLTEYCR